MHLKRQHTAAELEQGVLSFDHSPLLLVTLFGCHANLQVLLKIRMLQFIRQKTPYQAMKGRPLSTYRCILGWAPMKHSGFAFKFYRVPWYVYHHLMLGRTCHSQPMYVFCSEDASMLFMIYVASVVGKSTNTPTLGLFKSLW